VVTGSPGRSRSSEQVVDLAAYRVRVAPGALDTLAEVALATASAFRYAIVTDSNVGPLYADRARALLGDRTRVFTVPAGETHKTRRSWAELTDAMLAQGFGRDTTVVALGGGVVGDLAGFVAATYMRGVPYVQVPTTLLAMVDASVGGKTGVDTPAGKNLVGAFHQPAAVVADPELLVTLPRPQLRAGFAEALKHGVIWDAEYFSVVVDAAPALIEAPTDADQLTRIVGRSVSIKAGIVMRDERELGVRKVLNFGHTLGHAIELGSEYRLLHGEAVAIGMVLESTVAEHVGAAEPGISDQIRAGVRSLGLPFARPRDQDPVRIVAATRIDKKARRDAVAYALPHHMGAMAGADAGWSITVPDDVVLRVLS
jgi:3-dehydroquinate synthase